MSKRFDIGVLGGGQLGRMLIEEGRPGLTFKVLDPSKEAPCAKVADSFLCGSLQDEHALRTMAKDCKVLTTEIEAVDASILSVLQKEGHNILPSAENLARLQDKGLQKEFLQSEGFPTAPFVCITSLEDISKHKNLFPAVLKLRKTGYDGRGVYMCPEMSFLQKIGISAPSYLEKKVDIKKELAVIVARTAEGDRCHYGPMETVFHEENALDYLLTPADIPAEVAENATALANQICTKLNYVGVLAVELFWTKDDKILVNEMAPRVHNSGHHTREANDCSQFGQWLRILQGRPLGSTDARTMAALVNVLGANSGTGEPIYDLEKVLAEAGCYVYLYGKAKSYPFRKMGHVTVLAKNQRKLIQQVAFVKKHLHVRVGNTRVDG